jgi:hypothetical protein
MKCYGRNPSQLDFHQPFELPDVIGGIEFLWRRQEQESIVTISRMSRRIRQMEIVRVSSRRDLLFILRNMIRVARTGHSHYVPQVLIDTWQAAAPN